MNKKLAHTILVFGDLLSIGGLWIGFHLISQIQLHIANQDDIIRFSNRVGFFIVGIGFPLLHAISITEHFFPDMIKTYKRFLSRAVIVMLVLLLIAGFSGSSWITSQVENAGYAYCRDASKASALSKSLVFTKDLTLCEELIQSQKKHR